MKNLEKAAELAPKLYETYERAQGKSKIRALALHPSEFQAVWISVAQRALANTCLPDQCEHIKEEREFADSDRKAAFESLQAEHAKALEEAESAAFALGEMSGAGAIAAKIAKSGGTMCFADDKLGDDIRGACKLAINYNDVVTLARLLELRASLLPGRAAAGRP